MHRAITANCSLKLLSLYTLLQCQWKYKNCPDGRSKEAAGLPSRCWFVDKQTERTPCVNNAAGQEIQTQSKLWEFSQRRIMFWVVHWFSRYWKHMLRLIGCFPELEQRSLPLMANWGGIWLSHAASKAQLTGTLWSLVLLFSLCFCQLANSLSLLSSNAECVSMKLQCRWASFACIHLLDTLPVGAHLGVWLLLGL